MTREIYVNADGSLEMIYSDALVPAFAGDGTVVTVRASHVEPCRGGWAADLSPVGGPTLGPFAYRQAALDAEVAWLRARMAEGPL